MDVTTKDELKRMVDLARKSGPERQRCRLGRIGGANSFLEPGQGAAASPGACCGAGIKLGQRPRAR